MGNGGDNRFEPLSGADHVDGGGGIDRVTYQNDHEFPGNGNGIVGIKADLAKGKIVDTSGVYVDTVVSIENVTGSIFDDVIRGDGKANQLSGRDGDDVLVGRSGNDNLAGEAGNDVLRGGKGDDFLSGGRGDDLLLGNAGADVFLFRVGDGDDRIRDFQVGIDRIDVSDWGYANGADVVAQATQVGNHVVITNSGDTVTLINFDLANLDGSDFII